jgi:hypothetical protein
MRGQLGNEAFISQQNDLYTVSVAESEARASYDMEIRARERRREYGVSQAEEDEEMLRREEFSRTTLKQLEMKLKIVCQSYQVSQGTLDKTGSRATVGLLSLE